jgi:hypothetical protein
MELRDYLSVPYRLRVYSGVGLDGRWHRYAEYAEIACISEADTVIEAMEQLEVRRVDFIVEQLAQSTTPPVPRPPLRSTAESLSQNFLVDVAARIRRAARHSSAVRHG